MAAAVKSTIKSYFQTGDKPTQSEFEEFIDSYVDGFSLTTSPTINDDSSDGYVVGTHWIDTVTEKIFVCTNTTVGAAVWKSLATGTGATGKVAYWDGESSLTSALALTYSSLAGVVSLANTPVSVSTTAQSPAAIYGLIQVGPTSASTSTFIGVRGAASIQGANPYSAGASIVGVDGSVSWPTNTVSALSVAAAYGVRGFVTASTAEATNGTTFDNAYGLYAQAQLSTTSAGGYAVITNYYGLYLDAGLLSGTNATITNNYGVYQEDTDARNFFAGSFVKRVISVSASATISAAKTRFTGSTVSQTLTLPAGIAGLEYAIRNSGTVPVTVAAGGSDTIEGAATFVLYPGESIFVSYPDTGTDWTVF